MKWHSVGPRQFWYYFSATFQGNVSELSKRWTFWVFWSQKSVLPNSTVALKVRRNAPVFLGMICSSVTTFLSCVLARQWPMNVSSPEPDHETEGGGTSAAQRGQCRERQNISENLDMNSEQDQDWAGKQTTITRCCWKVLGCVQTAGKCAPVCDLYLICSRPFEQH